MTDHDTEQEITDLEQVSEELTSGLERCRSLLSAYRGKLAANSNEAEPIEEDGLLRQG